MIDDTEKLCYYKMHKVDAIMKFEDVEKIYYKNFNKHVNKEKFLEWLLKTINDIVELKDEIEI